MAVSLFIVALLLTGLNVGLILENLENVLKVEVSKLIRETLDDCQLDFIGGNELDILIDTNVDIESIVSKALIERKIND